MYTLFKNSFGDIVSVLRKADQAYIPLTEENTDYQLFIDNLNEYGFDIVDGEDIPDTIVNYAKNKKFQLQVSKYIVAKTRLNLHVLKDGKEETRILKPTGVFKSFPSSDGKENTKEYFIEDVIPAIAPEPEFIEVYEGEGQQLTLVTIRNPSIIKDEEERAAAQDVIDATPQEVIDYVNNK